MRLLTCDPQRVLRLVGLLIVVASAMLIVAGCGHGHGGGWG
jgi:hypothetical protein